MFIFIQKSMKQLLIEISMFEGSCNNLEIVVTVDLISS